MPAIESTTRSALGLRGHFGAGPQIKQRAGDGDQRAERARGEHVQDPGGAKQQISLPLVGLALQRAEEWKQDFADFQDADIDRFFEPLGNGVISDKLRREECTEQITIRLACDQGASLSHELPAAHAHESTKRLAMQLRARQPLACELARKRE